MKVKIPFYERFRKPMLDDVKTWTTRTKWYGDIGDTFEIFEHEFEIVNRFKMPLNFVALHWIDEGCDSREDFVQLWKKIHPRKGFVPNQEGKVHVFRRIS